MPQPTPEVWRPAIRVPNLPIASIQAALVAEAHHFLDENLFLLVIEASEERLSCVRNIALIHCTIVEELRFVSHLLDNIVGRVALGAGKSKIETVGAVMTEIMHCATKPGPVLFLLGREIQFGFYSIDVSVTGVDDLLGRQLRRLLLREHLRLPRDF